MFGNRHLLSSHPKDVQQKVRDTLIELGCCSKCVLRFVGVAEYDSYSKVTSSENQRLADLGRLDLSSEDDDDGLASKRRKTTARCATCLDITTELCDSKCVSEAVAVVKDCGYDADSFLFSLTVPTCLQLRQYSVWLRLKDSFPDVYRDKSLVDIASVKEVWKWSFGPLAEKELGMRFATNSPLDIGIAVAYDDDEAECNWIRGLVLDTAGRRKQQKGIRWSRTIVEKALASSKPETLKLSLPCPPPEPKSSCRYERIACFHAPIFMAGRYNKYSRQLSQTPWLIDGEKIMESSVQELIVAQVVTKIKTDDIIFSASGREDVDVRTLGRGRPFVLQLINPRRTKLSSEELKDLQDAINGSTEQIAVRDFQIVPKEATARLKEGEEEKIKTYSALCISKEPLNSLRLAALADIKDLKLLQRTPIRVLHRRPVAVREKTVHSMKAEFIDRHHFRLALTTQAGTYVKEFVHGDFGRTNPNLRSLLDADVDILELDVESIDLDWPPQL